MQRLVPAVIVCCGHRFHHVLKGSKLLKPQHSVGVTTGIALCVCVQIILRIAGTGVTPFGPANQERLIQVLTYGAKNISSTAFHVVLVADAYSSRRRALLAWPWESVQARPEA